jgi:hypothetical protein
MESTAFTAGSFPMAAILWGILWIVKVGKEGKFSINPWEKER